MIPARFPDLHGRVPVGAVLRIGRKDPQRGQPIENDRFYIVSPDMGELKIQRKGSEVDVGQRAELPEFRWFPSAKKVSFLKVIVMVSPWRTLIVGPGEVASSPSKPKPQTMFTGSSEVIPETRTISLLAVPHAISRRETIAMILIVGSRCL